MMKQGRQMASGFWNGLKPETNLLRENGEIARNSDDPIKTWVELRNTRPGAKLIYARRHCSHNLPGKISPAAIETACIRKVLMPYHSVQ